MIMLDTHAWIWWASDPDRLSKKALEAVDAAPRLAVAAISCWEFAMLVERGRITVDRNPVDWMEQSFNDLAIELLPLTPVVAVRSTQLGRGFHGDPADRQIVATSLVHSASLVTKDERIRDFKPVDTIW
jgi:PIN domain nuclease of toxin-antitoxin system